MRGQVQLEVLAKRGDRGAAAGSESSAARTTSNAINTSSRKRSLSLVVLLCVCRSSFNNRLYKKTRISSRFVSAIIHDIGSNKKLWLSQHNIAPVVKQMLVVQLGLLVSVREQENVTSFAFDAGDVLE